MSLIEKEFKDGNNEYWFYRKQQKNLHNIDSFYYTVMLSNDFTEPGDENVHFFVQQLDAFKNRLIETNQLYGDIATTYDPPGLVTDDTLVYTLAMHISIIIVIVVLILMIFLFVQKLLILILHKLLYRLDLKICG